MASYAPYSFAKPQPVRYATAKDAANMGLLPGGYPGSSGGFATGKGPDYSVGVQKSGPFGYAGDRFRSDPIDPALRGSKYPDGSADGASNNRLAELKAAYERGEIPFEKLFEQYQLPSKYPEVTGATSKAFGDIAATDKGAGTLDFNALKAEFTGANAEMTKRYDEFQKANDITGFAASQRAADAAAAGLTSEYATTARGQLGEAAGIGARYRNEGQGALDKYLGNAQDFYNKDIPASIQDAQDRAVAYTSRYGMSRGGQLGSDIGKIAGDSAVRAALPYQLQGRQYIGDALGRYQPFYGDVASRDYARVAGLNMPTEQNIYSQRQGDIMRGKGTEQQLQSLNMMVKERGLQAAVQNLKNQGLSQSIINSLVSEWQAQKSRSLGLVGQAADLEQRYGGERGYNYMPGSGPITQPQYYGMPQPNFPGNNPGRYPSMSPTIPRLQPPGAPGGEMNRIDQVMAYTAAHPQASQYGGGNFSSVAGIPPYRMEGGLPPYNPEDQYSEYDY